MARKIHIDSDYTIQQWIDSQNGMSDFMGDLSNFEARFKNTKLDDYPGYNDSSFVTALNFINDPWVEYLRGLFGGGKVKISAELLVDSAAFQTLRLADSTDSSANPMLHGPTTRPRFSKFYTHMFADTTGVNARHTGYDNGDDPTATSIYIGANNRWPNPDAPGIMSFDYDLTVQDSAFFNNIRVGASKGFLFQGADSCHFDYINIKDSGFIRGIGPNDSNDFIKIVFADIDSSSTIDSAYIGTLRSNNIINDSSTFGILRINNILVLDSNNATLKLEQDSPTFDGVSKFLITDSLGPDSPNDAGVIRFGSYKLDSI